MNIVRNIIIGLLIWVYVIGTGGIVWAETRYISDRMIVSLREQKGSQSKTIRGLSSDTPVTVLAEEDGFSKVRTEQGEEGWIPSRFLAKDTPKAIVIERLKAQLQQLSSTSDESVFIDCEKVCADLYANNTLLLNRLEQVEQDIILKNNEIQTLKTGLEGASASPAPSVPDLSSVEQQKEIKSLRETNERLQQEMTALKDKIKQRNTNHIIHFFADGKGWFVIGAAVFLTGLIFGLILNYSKRNRKYY